MAEDPELTGRAKGGAARAAKLSPEERSAIARKGALAAKARRLDPAPETQPDPGLPHATHQGQMAIGELMLDCYVLNDGRRVFHKRGMAKALGLKSAGGNAFMKTMQGKGLGSVLPPALQKKIDAAIHFTPLTGDKVGHGYEADMLADVAKAIVAASDAGASFTKAQESLVGQARILMNAFAKVGVIALIDEATGFQQIRDPNALRLLVQQYIAEEKRQWELLFENAFYDALNKVYNSKLMTTTAKGTLIQNRPQHFAKFTRSYVYEPLENGAVLEELDRINPKINARGTRRDRFHQHLSQGYGIEKLKRQMLAVQTLLDVSDNISQFKRLYYKKFGAPQGAQLDLLED